MINTFATKPVEQRSNDEVTIWRIGHASVLINFFGTWIITDPVFSKRFGVPVPTSPWNIGARRLHDPQLKIRQLPPIDIILISHAHMDHLHPHSCAAIARHSHHKTHIIASPGVKQWLKKSLQEKTTVLDRSQYVEIAWVRIQWCEVNHRWARYPWWPDRSKWHPLGASYNAYMLEKQWKRVFFGGDTAYTEAMQTYAPVWGVDLAIMPIGSYDPRIDVHCNPEQALQMAQMLGARNIVGIHWDSRWRPYKKREGDKPLRRFIESASCYDIKVLRKFEGEVVSI